MNVLVFGEQRDQKLKKSSFEAVNAGRRIADQLGGELVALVIGSGIGDLAKELGAYGAAKVLVADDPSLKAHSNTAYAKVIADSATKEGAQIVILAASQMGKDIAPRVAVRLGAGLASDCIAVTVDN